MSGLIKIIKKRRERNVQTYKRTNVQTRTNPLTISFISFFLYQSWPLNVQGNVEPGLGKEKEKRGNCIRIIILLPMVSYLSNIKGIKGTY